MTIFSCTNRSQSNSLALSKACHQLLVEKNQTASLFSMEQLPENIAFSEVFGKRTAAFDEIIQDYIQKENKFVFIVPEYNGSFPGILKVFLDAVPPSLWHGKKAGLIGLAQGRAGNLRGIEQLTLILNYLKMTVYHQKLPVSQIDKNIDSSGNWISAESKQAVSSFLDGFISF